MLFVTVECNIELFDVFTRVCNILRAYK